MKIEHLPGFMHYSDYPWTDLAQETLDLVRAVELHRNEECGDHAGCQSPLCKAYRAFMAKLETL